jgi:hypothetical protein
MEVGQKPREGSSRRALLLKVVYWLAVLAISLALVAGLILFLESRDPSSLDSSGNPFPAATAAR